MNRTEREELVNRRHNAAREQTSASIAVLLGIIIGGAAWAAVWGLLRIPFADHPAIWWIGLVSGCIAGLPVMALVFIVIDQVNAELRTEIAQLFAALDAGIACDQTFEIVEFICLFDKRSRGFAYFMHTADDRIIFTPDGATQWDQGDGREGPVPADWNPTSWACWPHRGFSISYAPSTGSIFFGNWEGPQFAPPQEIFLAEWGDWPNWRRPVRGRVIEESWQSVIDRYAGKHALWAAL